MGDATMSRRSLLALVAALGSGGAGAAPARPRPPVGALRWDAWYVPGSPETRAVERTLSDPRFAGRAPFFAEAAGDGARVTFPAATQAEMDAEIRLAAYAGLEFWAFVAYPAASPMSRALELYLASAVPGPVRFCLFAQALEWGNPQHWPEERRRHVSLMASPRYQRAAGGRPLYFLGFLAPEVVGERFGGEGGLRHEVSAFRQAARDAGLPDPYVVACGKPADVPSIAEAIGADAVGAYSLADGRASAPFSALAATCRRGWDELAASRLPAVPTVMCGWDRRPRVAAPVPWEHGQAAGAGIEHAYAAARPGELSRLLREAVAWAAGGGRRAPSEAVLVYAWNEVDEGGSLLPTARCGAAALGEVRSALLGGRAAPAPTCR